MRGDAWAVLGFIIGIFLVVIGACTYHDHSQDWMKLFNFVAAPWMVLFLTIPAIFVFWIGLQVFEWVRQFHPRTRRRLIGNRVHSLEGRLRALSQQVNTCEQVGQALKEVNEPLEGRTDYQRAQRIVMRSCNEALVEIRTIRRAEISPNVIRAEHHLRKVWLCCSRCLAVNKKRKSFTCLINSDKDVSVGGYRLNKRGDIVA
jgi:hypothetical protein